MPVSFVVKAQMALEALSFKDQEKVFADISRFEDPQYREWIGINSHKLADSPAGPLWTLRLDKSLRALYRIEKDESGEPYILVLDVAPQERLEKLVKSHGALP